MAIWEALRSQNVSSMRVLFVMHNRLSLRFCWLTQRAFPPQHPCLVIFPSCPCDLCRAWDGEA